MKAPFGSDRLPTLASPITENRAQQSTKLPPSTHGPPSPYSDSCSVNRSGIKLDASFSKFRRNIRPWAVYPRLTEAATRLYEGAESLSSAHSVQAHKDLDDREDDDGTAEVLVQQLP
jgi:hypothetical protein